MEIRTEERTPTGGKPFLTDIQTTRRPARGPEEQPHADRIYAPIVKLGGDPNFSPA